MIAQTHRVLSNLRSPGIGAQGALKKQAYIPYSVSILGSFTEKPIVVFILCISAILILRGYQASVVFLLTWMLLTDLLRFLQIPQGGLSTCLTLVGLQVLSMTFGPRGVSKVKTSKVAKFMAAFLALALPTLLALRDGPYYILRLLSIGYDNVGHFAILKALANCTTYLAKCGPAYSAIPTNYLYYPQQWHIAFAPLLWNNTVIHALESYAVLIIMSQFIAIGMVFTSGRKLVSRLLVTKGSPIHSSNGDQATKRQRKKNRSKSRLHANKNRDSNERLIHALPSLLIFACCVLMLYLGFLGYPNFILAIGFVVFGLENLGLDGLSERAIGSISFLLAASCYSLLTLPLMVCALVLVAGVQAKNRWFIALNSTIWVLYTTHWLYTSFSSKQAQYITFPGGSLLFILAIETIAALILFAKFQKLRYSGISGMVYTLRTNPLLLSQLIFMVFLLSIHAQVLLKGGSSGYYLYKTSYVLLILSLLGGGDEIFIAYKFLRKYQSRIAYNAAAFAGLIIFLHAFPNAFLNRDTLSQATKPMLTIRSYFNLATTDLSKSDADSYARYIRAAQMNTAEEKPMVILSSSPGPESQWVGALSAKWSQKLENEMEASESKYLALDLHQIQLGLANGFIFYKDGCVIRDQQSLGTCLARH